MPIPPDVEKVRQEIMRFRELLSIMRRSLDESESRYESLFAVLGAEAGAFPPHKEKDRQLKLAEILVNDTSELSKAVVRARFDARNLERDFEHLYNIIVTVVPEDAE